MRVIVLALALCILTGTLAHAADARAILDDLHRTRVLAAAEAKQGGGLAANLSRAIADAYGVKDVTKLQGRVFVALITDTRLTESTRFCVFADRDEHHSAASTIKVVLLGRLMAEIQQSGQKTKWGMNDVDWGPIARRMISHSDNAAANEILGRYGIGNVNRWLSSLGLGPDELSFEREFRASSRSDGKDNYATAAGLAKYFFLLAQEEDVDGFLKLGMLGKARQLLDSEGDNNNQPQFNDRLNANFPDGVSFMHKTGSNAAVLGDGGIVVDGQREFIIVAFDTKADKKAMQRLGRNLLDLMRETR